MKREIKVSDESKGKSSKNTLYCSFCGKSQHEVRKLIAGPTVFICDECVELCMDIINEEATYDSLDPGDRYPVHFGIEMPFQVVQAGIAPSAAEIMGSLDVSTIRNPHWLNLAIGAAIQFYCRDQILEIVSKDLVKAMSALQETQQLKDQVQGAEAVREIIRTYELAIGNSDAEEEEREAITRRLESFREKLKTLENEERLQAQIKYLERYKIKIEALIASAETETAAQ